MIGGDSGGRQGADDSKSLFNGSLPFLLNRLLPKAHSFSLFCHLFNINSSSFTCPHMQKHMCTHKSQGKMQSKLDCTYTALYIILSPFSWSFMGLQ